MATLSVKVATRLADAFQQYAEDNETTVSALLRQFVEITVKFRRFEVCEPLVGPPAGWLFLDPDWFG